MGGGEIRVGRDGRGGRKPGGTEGLRRRGRRTSEGDCVGYLELEVPLLTVLVGEMAAVIVVVDVLRSLFVFLSSASPSSSSVSSTASPTALVVAFLRLFLSEPWVIVFQLLLESRFALRAFDSGDLVGRSSSTIRPSAPIHLLFPSQLDLSEDLGGLELHDVVGLTDHLGETVHRGREFGENNETLEMLRDLAVGFSHSSEMPKQFVQGEGGIGIFWE